MSRPGRIVAVAGTGTGIGKTWLGGALARSLRDRGRSVAARKPVQSYDDRQPEPTDADVLAEATGEPAETICPSHRWYPVPMAPPMAADVLDLPGPTLAELVAELRWPDPAVGIGLVETVGGVRSPVAVDADSRDLLGSVDPDEVVLVADAGLGTIDAVRLAADALDRWPVTVFLNRFDPAVDLHRRNLDWLVHTDGRTVEHEVDALARRVAELSSAR